MYRSVFESMSDNSDKISNHAILCYGYCRECEKENKIVIPTYLVYTLAKFVLSYIIYGIGNNRFGQLGIDRNRECQNKWVRLIEMEHILIDATRLFVNHRSIMIPSINGKIYVAGKNNNYRLGIDDDQIRQRKFRAIDKIKSWNIIASHSMGNLYHTFIYVNNSHLYRNGFGERWDWDFGDKSIDILSSVRFFNDKTITSITCTECDSYFLTNRGTLYRSTEGDIPTLIHGNIKQIDGGGNYVIYIDSKDSLLIQGELGVDDGRGYVTYFVENKLKIKEISAGRKHAAVITMDGQGYMFGEGKFGKCGVWCDEPLDTTKTKYLQEPCRIKLQQDDSIKKISCGDSHTVLVTSDLNHIYSFGYNGSHRCSRLVGTDVHIMKPYQINKSTDLQINENDFIENVIAAFDSSIIMINPFKKIKKTKRNIQK